MPRLIVSADCNINGDYVDLISPQMLILILTADRKQIASYKYQPLLKPLRVPAPLTDRKPVDQPDSSQVPSTELEATDK